MVDKKIIITIIIVTTVVAAAVVIPTVLLLRNKDDTTTIPPIENENTSTTTTTTTSTGSTTLDSTTSSYTTTTSSTTTGGSGTSTTAPSTTTSSTTTTSTGNFTTTGDSMTNITSTSSAKPIPTTTGSSTTTGKPSTTTTGTTTSTPNPTPTPTQTQTKTPTPTPTQTQTPSPSPTPTPTPTQTQTQTPTPTPTQTPTPTPTQPSNAFTNLKVNSIKFAQTHVIPAQGQTWNLPSISTSLHLVGNRETLILVQYSQLVSGSLPLIKIYNPNNGGGLVLATTLVLNTPDQLPPTSDNWPTGPYLTNTYSVKIPAQYIVPNMLVQVSSDSSGSTYPIVGMDVKMRIFSLPMYFFGATEANSKPMSVVGVPTAAQQGNIFQQWPVSELEFYNHPMQKTSWDYVAIYPTNGYHAKRVYNTDQFYGMFDLMGWLVTFLQDLRTAFGESKTNNLLYVPMLTLNSKGAYSAPLGGLGGNQVGTGDFDYSGGIYIHEMGHAWGLMHSADAYNQGKYPYKSGTVGGSTYGWRSDTNEFISTYLPPSDSRFVYCKYTTDFQVVNGMCAKQDIMQSGNMYPDFDMSVMQNTAEGTTTRDGSGNHVYNGGMSYYIDETDSYIRWDSLDSKYVPVTISNNSGLIYLDGGYPYKRDIDVYTIVISYNSAPTSSCKDCSFVYPVSKSVGNMMRYIDPSVQSQIDLIKTPNTGSLGWFCSLSGCDYTLRVTYKDGSKFHKLIQRGQRDFSSQSGSIMSKYLDPTNSASLNVFTENVPANKVLSQVELLWTPMGYSYTTPSNAQVLVSQSY